MQKLFENWRRFTNEASQLTIDRDTFINKVVSHLEKQGMHGEPRPEREITGGESVGDIFYMLNKRNIPPVGINIGDLPEQVNIDQIKSDLTEFGKRRGWNLLIFDYNQTHNRIRTTFDSDRATSESYVTAGEITSLADVTKYYLFHVTTVDYAKKILQQGIKPRKVSGDDVMFGNGRAYFFIGERIPQEVITALDPMEGTEVASGAKNGLKTVLAIDPAKINKNIKFSIDTEFEDVDAIWTQSHIKPGPQSIWELTKYRQSEEDFKDIPDDEYDKY